MRNKMVMIYFEVVSAFMVKLRKNMKTQAW